MRQILEPLERYSGCRLALRWTSNVFRYDTELIIETNITQFRIPLAVFDGHFTISTSTDSNPLFEVRTLQYEKPGTFPLFLKNTSVLIFVLWIKVF